MKLFIKKAAPTPAPPPTPAPKPTIRGLIFKKPVQQPIKAVASEITNAKNGNLDELAAFDIGNSRNCLVPWYLMASYLYYVRDVSLLSDGYYDRICHELNDNFKQIKHWHKHLVDQKQLDAGTGFRLRFDQFPSRIISAANTLAHEVLGVPYPGQPKEKE
jgi:hypothetical protein